MPVLKMQIVYSVKGQLLKSRLEYKGQIQHVIHSTHLQPRHSLGNVLQDVLARKIAPEEQGQPLQFWQVDEKLALVEHNLLLSLRIAEADGKVFQLRCAPSIDVAVEVRGLNITFRMQMKGNQVPQVARNQGMPERVLAKPGDSTHHVEAS